MAKQRRKLSKEHKEKIRKSMLGKNKRPSPFKGKKRDPTIGRKISLSKMGHKHSPETKEKMRQAKLKNPTRYWLGKHITKEMKEAIGKSNRAKKRWIGPDNPRWNNGRTKTRWGYVLISSPKHPFKDSHGYVCKHRLVMEKHLGRYLKPEEVVHHINDRRDDNRLKNLMLFPNNAAHMAYHDSLKKSC